MNQKDKVQGEPHYYSEQLKKKLNGLLTAPTAIVEAPSGYGKTTAIRDFLEDGLPKDTPVYWFTAVDEAPAAAFHRLCREIDKIDSLAGGRLLNIELPNAATVGEAADALRSIQCKQDAWLIIDNFQFLQAALMPAFFDALMDHGGEGLHIVIITQMLKRNFLSAVTSRGALHITSAELRLGVRDIRRYYSLSGLRITEEEAKNIAHYTDGWIIAVYLQLRSFRETGALSDTSGIFSLMEHLIWSPLTWDQQTFLLRLSSFEMVTVQQACALTGLEALPGYAKDALELPFIRYEPDKRRYELHSILSELLITKREERGKAFTLECLLRAGDLCRDEGRNLEAMGFYWQIKDYERMLSLDLSHMILEEIGDIPFSRLALDTARNCPAEIKRRYPLSMLRMAWTLLITGLNEPFMSLMEELHMMLKEEEDSRLLGEWTLLSSFLHHPGLEQMTAVLRKAKSLLEGRRSQVVLPTDPWCFGSYYPLAEFHTIPGEADREADALEEYIALYSALTGGHGSGADVLFRAELAYNRGELEQAEILAYKAVYLAETNRQSVVQLGSAMLLAGISLNKADTAGWQHAITSMERAASYTLQNTFVVRSLLDIVRGTLLIELKVHENIADWLKQGNFSERTLLNRMLGDALYVYLSCLLLQGDMPRLLGVVQAIALDEKITRPPFVNLLFSILEAICYVKMGQRAKAAALVAQTAQETLPDGLILPLASYSWALEGIPDELIAEKYPELLNHYNAVKERFGLGWDTLHDGMFPDVLHDGSLPHALPPGLTSREYEVAKLAAEGLRNSEIAAELVVSESTVRAHLRTIFQKLDIDRRARLAERLK